MTIYLSIYVCDCRPVYDNVSICMSTYLCMDFSSSGYVASAVCPPCYEDRGSGQLLVYWPASHPN